ncbi:MAG: hypothetical protein MUF34_33565 [Polyangiaceae bacterium]|jgi:hypothetical protein|nr:hypothetical protein [Polyangiaceae bacterium]
MIRSDQRVACRTGSRQRAATRVCAALVAAAGLAPSLPASAQTGSSTERIAAEALFREALQMMGDGNYAEACPKLAESQRLDPGLGTLVNLALCHEAEGKTASAWAEFNEAASLARQNKRADRERVARAHIKTLEPKLARLSVRVSPEARALAGLEVLRDGIVIKEGVWGSPIPVDPGKHEVSASASGYEVWTTTVEVPAEAGQHDVTVPELTKKKKEDPPASEPALGTPSSTPSSTPASSSAVGPLSLSQRTVGLIVGGTGVAALLVGGYFGYRAIDKAGDVDKRCPESNCADAGAVSLNDEAGRAATASNIALGVGLVGIGVGAFLVLTAPPPGDRKPAAGRSAPAPAAGGAQARWISPVVGRDHVSLGFGGVW